MPTLNLRQDGCYYIRHRYEDQTHTWQLLGEGVRYLQQRGVKAGDSFSPELFWELWERNLIYHGDTLPRRQPVALTRKPPAAADLTTRMLINHRDVLPTSQPVAPPPERPAKAGLTTRKQTYDGAKSPTGQPPTARPAPSTTADLTERVNTFHKRLFVDPISASSFVFVPSGFKNSDAEALLRADFQDSGTSKFAWRIKDVQITPISSPSPANLAGADQYGKVTLEVSDVGVNGADESFEVEQYWLHVYGQWRVIWENFLPSS